MALHFPLMVNGRRIGEVEIVRRDDPISDSGEFTYDWCVATVRDGVKAAWDGAGELRHRYADGAFVLAGRVLEAYARQSEVQERQKGLWNHREGL